MDPAKLVQRQATSDVVVEDVTDEPVEEVAPEPVFVPKRHVDYDEEGDEVEEI